MKKKDNFKNDKEQNMNKDEYLDKGLGDGAETECDCGCGCNQAEDSASSQEVEELKSKLEEKTKQCDDYFNMLQRTAAEFDNFKKRTAREKEALYLDATIDVVAAFLPVIDNIERAVQAANNDAGDNSLKEGIDLVYRQFKDVMKKLNVEAIEAVGKEFDPNLHNAVSHIDDEQYGENVVAEEFQKGYIFKDKVIRHSMVKVAN
ncbi:nucleotide exchange factor GrpE [Acetivibrio cellulolyticus]|uniref:nucleotide exchange factor GrpE n=1 Tax=Acetivibrio cellulolyticus TaxID=35830 RepID=UPI0001E2C1E8|nr:nucleotide exchange factor GrpE [Acetivibrio cellulolyticus]